MRSDTVVLTLFLAASVMVVAYLVLQVVVPVLAALTHALAAVPS